MPNFIAYSRRELDSVLSDLAKSVYTVVGDLAITAWRTREPRPFAQRQTGQRLDLSIGDRWGDLFDCAWFHFTGQIPEAATGQPVVLLLDVNGEMCVVDRQGVPVRGLTNVSSEFDDSLGRPGKRILPITLSAQGGAIVDVWADASCNDLFGNLQENGVVKEAAIAVCHEELRALYYDFEVLLDLLKVLPPDSARHQQILTALNDVRWQLAREYAEAAARSARDILRPMLAKRGGDPALNISAVGHAHLDLAWLWPVRETRRKGARTFATAMANMELYPDYVFGASQPQLYQWLKDDQPTLYERVTQRVKEGRFEPQGAMWVEADTNLPGGEALIRQIVLGKHFFKREFGLEIHHLWLPDVFGYSAALPQILKQAGVDYFMTQKLSWNQINHFPYHSFHWQGIDGSTVLAHMLPEETYNSPAAPRSVIKIEQNYQEKGVSDCSLMLFGIGDGGGGPGEEHLERLARLGNLAGLAPVRQETASAFFERWKKDASRFPTWVGELYLERHSGTLTTEARNKWYNRRMEQTLRELEWMAVLVGEDYPTVRLDAIWREVLLYQFHDILPGSSIKRVYDESLARYREMLAEVEGLINRYEDRLAQQVNTAGLQSPVLFFNSLSWERSEWVRVNERWKRISAPALGYCAVDLARGDALPIVTATAARLENDVLRVEFDQDGSIASIYDKEIGREVIAEGQRANRLAVYHDTGDAWDFSLDYASQTPEYMKLISAEPRIDGPQAILMQAYQFGHSELIEDIVLTAGSRRLDFNTHVRWRTTAAMLRTSFPVAIHAESAVFEIQLGHIHRPTHRNTTWDLAKDEVAAHKWADLSQGDYGVALLNDSKYGHKINGNVIDLNLVRSVPYPGPRPARQADIPPGDPDDGYTDQADHVFKYALYPHPGGLVNGRVVQAGYEFNYALRHVTLDARAGVRPAVDSLLEIDAPNILVEAIKKAEDDTDIILRLYEAFHASTPTTVHFGFNVKGIVETNLLEEIVRPLTLKQNGVELFFKPFEIKTLKVSV